MHDMYIIAYLCLHTVKALKMNAVRLVPLHIKGHEQESRFGDSLTL